MREGFTVSLEKAIDILVLRWLYLNYGAFFGYVCYNISLNYLLVLRQLHLQPRQHLARLLLHRRSQAKAFFDFEVRLLFRGREYKHFEGCSLAKHLVYFLRQ